MKTKTTIALALAGALALPALSFAKEHEEKEATMTMSQLPAAVQKAVKQKIGNSKVVRVEKENEHGTTRYEVVVVQSGKETGMAFDQNGKFLNSHDESREKGEKH
jgi:uncharacterized membrane protein YkoI